MIPATRVDDAISKGRFIHGFNASRVPRSTWYRLLVFSVSVLALSGCWVGRVSVSLPERLPPQDLPRLAGPITFDVCLAPPGPPRTEVEWDRERRERGRLIQTILSDAGVLAELTPVAGSSVVFTVRIRETNPFDSWSTWLSFLTFSLVPGYSVGSKTLDVDLAEPGPKKEHLQYEFREAFFFWVPLIVYPDLLGTTSGGWQSSKMDDADKNRFPRLVQRLADDIRVRLGNAGGEGSRSRVSGVMCPMNER
jgi:hypothetical protein